MTDNNTRASLSDCHTDALILHGLVQAMEELQGSTTPQAFQATGALLMMIERMAGCLSNDLEALI